MPTALENLEIWMKTESSVHSVYPNFLSNLAARHSSLTAHEIKICMLTLLKRSPTEIMEIMDFNDVHAVHVSVSRIRQKLGSEKQPLIDTLLTIAEAE